MRSQKKTRFFSLGRKWVFTLALFLLVFAAASIVKVQAGTEHSVTGWLWGGGAGSSDGTNTNVGWISMNNTNQSGATNYGVNIPAGNGDVTGYAWSEYIGWVSFNSGDLAGCTGASGARREGHFLKGWARIISIRDAAGNAGGWLGCIKLSSESGDPITYGVDIDKMLGVSSGSHTYAWSDELGWIDFGQAKYTETSTLNVKPNPLTLQSGNNPGALFATLTNSSGPVNGKQIKFTILPGGSPKISLISSTCSTGATGQGECSVSAKASDLLTDETAQIQAECADSSCNTTTTINIKHTPVCIISCPDSIDIVSGQTKDYDVTSSGEAGCGEIDRCSMASNSYGLSSAKLDGNTCQVTSSSTARFGSAKSTSYTIGNANCPTTVNIKGPGWIETNPN